MKKIALAWFLSGILASSASAQDDIFRDGFDPVIACNWTGARWLSHGYDGANAFESGAWLSCNRGRLSFVLRINNAGTAVTPTPRGTADALVGCNWGSGTRWASEGWDTANAFTYGARATCNGTRVTAINWAATAMPGAMGLSGDLGCNWTGAIFLSHGWDGACAFQTGFGITCHSDRITHFEWIESAACPRAQ